MFCSACWARSANENICICTPRVCTKSGRALDAPALRLSLCRQLIRDKLKYYTTATKTKQRRRRRRCRRSRHEKCLFALRRALKARKRYLRYIHVQNWHCCWPANKSRAELEAKSLHATFKCKTSHLRYSLQPQLNWKNANEQSDFCEARERSKRDTSCSRLNGQPFAKSVGGNRHITRHK
jgi:hypothetical protein